MNRCDECKHKDSCVCVPYGCECFEIDLEEHDAKVKEEIIEDVITYVLNAYKYDSLTKEQLKNILNEAKEVCR